MVGRHRMRRLPVQQLLILSICRFAEPLSLTSVFPYLPEMIESFNIPTNGVSKWAGVTSAVYSLSQAVTGIAWGRASDSFGRKPVILVSMMAIMTTSVLFGFSQTLAWAIVARALAGASCGTVGIIRTMVAEMVPYKELQPKAFSVMPLVWTIGSIFGPSFGGALANPALRYPEVFGASQFFKTYPFVLPNLVGAAFFLLGLVVGTLFLKETLETKKDRRDWGLMLGKLLVGSVFPFKREKPGRKRSLQEEQSTPLLKHVGNSPAAPIESDTDGQGKRKAIPLSAPPTYREIFSRQSNLNLLTYSILALHSLAYDQLLPVFMHYPQQTDRSTNPHVHLPFKFSGGFGLNSDRIGLLFTIYGFAGVFIQFFAFPPLARHYGVLPCLKVVTIMLPIAYIVTPFTALLPTTMSQQIGILIVMIVKSWASIFAFPCITILLTNSASSLRVLGTLNGVAVSISGIGRAAGPAIGGITFTVGADKGYGILPWWTLGGIGILGAVAPWWLVETDGFGDKNEDEDIKKITEDGAVLQNDTEEEARSSGILVGNESVAEAGEYQHQFSTESDQSLGTRSASQAIRRTSDEIHFGSDLERSSSPQPKRQKHVTRTMDD